MSRTEHMRRAAAIGAGLAIAAVASGLALRPQGAPAEADGPRAAAVADGRPVACSPLEVRQVDATGGCLLRAQKAKLAFTTLSLFGDEPLGRCPVRFDLRVGPTGELAIERIAVEAYVLDDPRTRQAACGDIVACRPHPATASESDPGRPWSGRVAVSAGGALRAELRICFDTCFGRFEGPASLRLRPVARGAWRLEAERQAIGLSGLEIDGGWLLRPVAADTVEIGG